MKAMSNIHKFEDRGVPFAAWLFRIAKSEVYQSYRDNVTTRFVNIETTHLTDIIDEIDEDENDLCDGVLGDKSYLCPPVCGNANALNSDVS